MARWERGEATSEDEVIISHASSRQGGEHREPRKVDDQVPRQEFQSKSPLAWKQMTRKANFTSEGRRPHPEKYDVRYPSYTTVTPDALR